MSDYKDVFDAGYDEGIKIGIHLGLEAAALACKRRHYFGLAYDIGALDPATIVAARGESS